MEGRRKITLVIKSQILAAPEQVGQSSLVPGPKIVPIVPVTSDTSPSVEHGGGTPARWGQIVIIDVASVRVWTLHKTAIIAQYGGHLYPALAILIESL